MKKKETASEQKGNAGGKTSYYLKNSPTEASATRTSSYLENLQLLTTLIGEYPPNNLVTEELAHTNSSGMKNFSLPI